MINIESFIELCENQKICIESGLKSDLDENFKKKKIIKLSSLKKLKITQELCKRLGKKYKHLKHIRIQPNTNGYFFMNKDEIIVTIMVEEKENGEKWIQALEVNKLYSGHNLGNQILDYAVKTMGAKFLSVYKDNKVALTMYKKYGFKIYDETDYMYFMKL